MKKLSILVFLLALTLILCSCSPSSHKHEYDEGTVTKEVTCTTAGTIEYKCKTCEHVYTKTVEAGHKWTVGTCSEAKTCTRCNETVGEAPGHTYENNICTKCQKELNLELTFADEIPLTIKNYKGDTLSSTFEITDISYTVSGASDTSVTVTIILNGEKTQDIYGTSRNTTGKIAYKIYDEEGFVIFSSTKDTVMLVEGDKFKDLKISLSGFNAEQKYTLELLDYYS